MTTNFTNKCIPSEIDSLKIKFVGAKKSTQLINGGIDLIYEIENKEGEKLKYGFYSIGKGGLCFGGVSKILKFNPRELFSVENKFYKILYNLLPKKYKNEEKTNPTM